MHACWRRRFRLLLWLRQNRRLRDGKVRSFRSRNFFFAGECRSFFKRAFLQRLLHQRDERVGPKWFGNGRNYVWQRARDRRHFVNMTRHHDDRHTRRALVSADAATNFVAFDIGKDIIGQDEIGNDASGFLDAIQAGKGGCYL